MTRHDNISCFYHTMLFVQPSCMYTYIYLYIFNPTYLLHMKDILIILMRQTTDITDSKRVFLNTHTAWTEHVQSMQYVSFNGTDVLYHVSNTTFFFCFFPKREHRTYKCCTPSWSRYKCISPLDCRRIFYFFLYWCNTTYLFKYRDDYTDLYINSLVLFKRVTCL